MSSEQLREQLQERRFGKCVVRTWKRTGYNWVCSPWLFSVQEDGGEERRFVGVPNYCDTRHSALMRGWHRAKWINNGTYGDHYTAVASTGDLK